MKPGQQQDPANDLWGRYDACSVGGLALRPRWPRRQSDDREVSAIHEPLVRAAVDSVGRCYVGVMTFSIRLIADRISADWSLLIQGCGIVVRNGLRVANAASSVFSVALNRNAVAARAAHHESVVSSKLTLDTTSADANAA